jgi:hypothetical protein
VRRVVFLRTLVGGLLASCAGGDAPTVCLARGAIVDGTAAPPAALGAASGSVVALRVRHHEGGHVVDESCTGVRVDARHVVTAAHCFSADPALTVALSSSADCAPELGAAAVRVHPTRDVALVTTAPSTDVATSACAEAPELDAPAIAAGYGLDERGAVGTLHFLDTSVVQVDAEMIGARAAGPAGTCVGDSGGPLFVERAGAWCVAGTVSTGSADCRGLTRYEALAPLAAWLAAP